MASVLVAEDEPAVLKVMETILREAGHQVFRADSGRKASVVLLDGKRDYHLVVADIVMPGLSRLDLAEWICR